MSVFVRGDDFVSGLRIDGGDGAVNGGGSGGTRNGVLYSQHLCESPFDSLTYSPFVLVSVPLRIASETSRISSAPRFRPLASWSLGNRRSPTVF